MSVGAGLLAVLGVVVLFNGGCGGEPEVTKEVPSVDIAEKATFVGRESCIRCHEIENRMWEGSHHDLAMQEANERTVLGDFDDERGDLDLLQQGRQVLCPYRRTRRRAP
jgi:hypothetical protein